MATYEQAMEALKRADAAGNTEDARKLAQLAASLKPQADAQPMQAPAPEQNAPQQSANPQDQGAMSNFLHGLGQGALDVGETIYKPTSWIQDKMLGAVGLKGIDRNNVINQADASRAKYDQQYGGSLAAGAGRIGGQLAVSVPVMAAGGAVAGGLAKGVPALESAAGYLSGSGGLSSKVASGALQGGTAAGLVSSASNNPVRDVALGAAFGGALPLAYQGAKAAGSSLMRHAIPTEQMSPEVIALANAAEQHGIKLNAAQITKNPTLRLLDSVTRKVPFSGATSEMKAQQMAFNRAVSNTFGSDTNKITPEVYQAAKSRIGSQFQRLSAKNTLSVDNQLASDLAAVADDAQKFADPGTVKAVQSALDTVREKTQNGLMPGRAYQSLDSKLGVLMKTGGEKAHYLGQVRNALRDAMDNSISPQDQAAWQTARQQYRNLKTVRDLIVKDATDGNINPALLMGRVASNSAGKEAVAGGYSGDLGELAKIGQRFLKDTVPNSGTADRALMYSTLAAGPFAPVTVGSTVGSANLARRVLNSDAYRNVLLARAMNPPVQQAGNTVIPNLLQYGSPTTSLGLLQALRQSP